MLEDGCLQIFKVESISGDWLTSQGQAYLSLPENSSLLSLVLDLYPFRLEEERERGGHSSSSKAEQRSADVIFRIFL